MLSKWAKMSVREAMIAIEGRAPGHGELPNMLVSIAKKAGISFRTARSLWQGTIKNPEEHLAAREVRRLAQEEEAKRARHEARELAAKYEAIAERLNANDPDFYSADALALVHAARVLRGLDRT